MAQEEKRASRWADEDQEDEEDEHEETQRETGQTETTPAPGGSPLTNNPAEEEAAAEAA